MEVIRRHPQNKMKVFFKFKIYLSRNAIHLILINRCVRRLLIPYYRLNNKRMILRLQVWQAMTNIQLSINGKLHRKLRIVCKIQKAVDMIDLTTKNNHHLNTQFKENNNLHKNI